MFEKNIKHSVKSDEYLFSMTSRESEISNEIMEREKETSFYVIEKPDDNLYSVSYFGLNMKDRWNDRSLSIYHSTLEDQKIGEIQVHYNGSIIEYDATRFRSLFMNSLDLFDMVRDMGNVGNFSIQGVADSENYFLCLDIYDFDYNRYLDFSEAIGVFKYYNVYRVSIIEPPSLFMQKFYNVDDMKSYSINYNSSKMTYILKSFAKEIEISLRLP